MIINIVKPVQKFRNYEKVTFTSEKNKERKTINIKRSDNDYERLTQIENWIANNIPETDESIEGEYDTSKLEKPVKEEPKKTEPKELSEEEKELKQKREELNIKREERDNVSKEIAKLIKGMKEDKELIEIQEKFGYQSTEFENIIKDKEKRKFDEFVSKKEELESIKTDYNKLKSEVESLESSICDDCDDCDDCDEE